MGVRFKICTFVNKISINCVNDRFSQRTDTVLLIYKLTSLILTKAKKVKAWLVAEDGVALHDK